MSNELRVIPLGGLGEFGLNMLALECGDDIIVVDAGTLFPGSDFPGIDAAVPDLSYLRSRKDRVRGLLLTHAHLDHIGAVPHVLQELDVPAYGTAFTLGLVRKQLSEFTLASRPTLETIVPGQEVRLGCFGVRGIHVTHSTLQCLALAISTPAGCVVHTGDFKIDQTPVDGRKFDFEAFAELGREGVLLLLSDSTNADQPGTSESESTVGDALDGVFAECQEALYFTCFSSAVHRLQQIVDRTVEHRRKLAFVGRSLASTSEIARSLGLLTIPDGTLVDIRKLQDLPRSQRVAVVAGSQGEPRSSLTRASRGQHNWVHIEEGDTVAFSAKMIPGNEKPILRVIDNLYRCGAKVLYGSTYPGLHASGHPCREELKLLLNLLLPRYFMPIHGDFRLLAKHHELARNVLGKSLEDAFLVENGSVLQIDELGARVLPDRVQVGRRLIDAGTSSVIEKDGTVAERRRLSSFGMLVPVVTINRRRGTVVDVEILDRGFAVSEKAEQMVAGAEETIRETVRRSDRGMRRDFIRMEQRIERDVQRYLARKTSRQSRPLIVPVLLEA